MGVSPAPIVWLIERLGPMALLYTGASGSAWQPCGPLVPRAYIPREPTPSFDRRNAMRMLYLSLVLTSLLACSSGDAASGQREGTLAIHHVTVIDVTGGPSRPDQTVLISGNRITAVGNASEVKIPRGMPTIDATGKYLIPGLWDMHTHVTMFGPTGLSLYLANGVTGVRDMGAERFAAAKALRDSIAAGQRAGPRMRIASPIVENPRWLAAVKQMGEKAGTPW